jgi:hypothetical protein
MGNYVTAAAIRAYKVAGNTVDLTSYTDDDINDEIEVVEQQIETVCNDIFYLKTVTNLFDGNGLTELFMPPTVTYRLLTVTSLTELDVDGSTVLDTFVEGKDFKLYPYYVQTTLAVDGDTPRRRFGSGGVWPKGQSNISIAGTWGRVTTPAMIKKAAKLLTLENLIPGSAGLATRDVSQAVWPDFTVTFKGTDDVGASTGFAEVDRLLRDHINWVDMFNVVPNKRSQYGAL